MINGDGNGRGERQEVSKAFGFQDRYAQPQYQRPGVSPARQAQFGAGAGIGLWGASRSLMIGDTLMHGLKQAETRGATRAAQAYKMALVSGGLLQRGTKPIGPALRRINRINAAVEAIPRAMRPGVAMLVGGALMRNARDNRYR